ncbi:MAG: HAD hydrolase-like protein [Candidatus Saganbacteria bacterium]|nr:HAD hydrolase-like protein [Candidatus Saganbacteria bacterium]
MGLRMELSTLLDKHPGVGRYGRKLGVDAALVPGGASLYRAAAAAYEVITGDHDQMVRRQANIARALPLAWNGLYRYEQVYPLDAAPFHTVDMNVLIDHYDVFFIDALGTYKDESPIWQGAIGALKAIQQRGKTFLIVSNTPDLSVEFIIDQFKGTGVVVTPDQVAMAGQIFGKVFEKFGLKGKTVFDIGNTASAEYLKQAGVKVERDPHADFDAIVISKVKHLLYAERRYAARLTQIREVLREKVLGNPDLPVFLANADRALPFSIGFVENPAFSLAQYLVQGTSRPVDPETGKKYIVVGKPSIEIYEEALRRVSFLVPMGIRSVLCIGDTLWTDIQGANRLQLARPDLQVGSLLVLSGTEKKVNNMFSPRQLFKAMTETGIIPTAVLPRFALPG